MQHSAICPLCEATCGLKVTTENGKVVTIRGDADDPFSQRYICPKGYALKALEEDPDRLTQPLIHGKPASWDAAFALIAEKLPGLLPDVALYLGNPNVHNLAGQLYVPALARILQGRNLYSASTLDQMPKHVACTMMFGDPMSIPIPDLERTQYLLILGANPLVSNGSLMTAPNVKKRLKQIRQRGGKIVVLDPRRTLTADNADEHHFLRPGSDAFLLLGILQTLHQENLIQPVPHSQGAEQIAQLVTDKTPEKMQPHCGIPAETIRRLARELGAAAPSAAVYGRLGTCTQEFGTLVSWLIEVVNALTGNLDRPGGAMFPKAAAGAKNTAPGGRPPRPGQLRTRVRGLPQVNGEFPTIALAEEILTPGEGQIRGLITIAGNPALSAPDSDQMQKALEQLEFMVSIDCYLNETTRHADVILPVPSHLQRSHYDIVFAQLAVHNYARYSAPVFPLEPGQRDEWQIVLELARILSGQPVGLEQMDQLVAGQLQQRYGLKEPLRQDLQGPERLLDIMLRGGPYPLDLAQVQKGPVDLGPLQPRLPEVLRTASGLVELAPPELVQDLQRLQPQAAEFVLIGRRELRSNNSWMHNLPLLVKGPPLCTLLIHPQDAEKLGLQDGALATVSTSEASLEIPVEISDAIMPGVVSIPHGWGHHETGQQVAAQHAGVNVNRLLSTTRLDPLSGNAVQNAVPVSIARV